MATFRSFISISARNLPINDSGKHIVSCESNLIFVRRLMHTFLCYRMETLNDPLLQITWKSLASSCKERGVFFASGPVVVGIIIAHLSHSWDFQNYLRWPLPTKLWKAHSVVYVRSLQGFLAQTIFCERYWRTCLWETETLGAPSPGGLWLESSANTWLKYSLTWRR